MEHAVFMGFLSLASWLFALLEIQIEGRHGWAQKLPTWRIENKWTRIFYKKPLTGYHLYAQGFIFLMAHSPFGLNLVPWNFYDELRILSFVVLFWIVEDFLWFSCNRITASRGSNRNTSAGTVIPGGGSPRGNTGWLPRSASPCT